jgi:hypothetical protein
MKRVYIASPYTLGDVAVNVKVQLDVADQLMTLGFSPYVPLLTHFQHIAHPRPYADWCRQDDAWIPCCDYLLRLPGESKGADREVELAASLGIPVFTSIDEIPLG